MAVDLGEHLVGLRSNDEEVVDVLRRVLAPVRVDGVDVFPNLSLHVGERSGRVRPMHRVHRRGVTVTRTPSVGRLVRSALRHLDGFLPPPEGLVPLGSDTMFGAHGALLVNGGFARFELPERRLARLGWRGTDGLPTFLDPVASEVVVPQPRVPLAPDVLAEIDRHWPADRDDDVVPPGRYPIRAALLLGTQPDHLLVTSPARRWASLASLIDTSVWPLRAADVAALGSLDGHVEVRRVLGFDTGEVVGELRALAA